MDSNIRNAVIRIAKQYSYEPAALLAIVEVESAGKAFWNVNGKSLPPVRFEGHYFYKRLSGSKLSQAVRDGLAAKSAGVVANPRDFASRYALIERAALLDKAAAYESTSWGLGQVMGANWKALGYSDVFELVSDAYTVDGQVEMIVRFIEANNLKRHVDSLNWSAFARAYNGPAYKKNSYDTKMANAYKRYKNNTIKEVEVDAVSHMQSMLNAVGDYGLKVDGDYGVNTKTAVRDFQLQNGLAVDGIYGPITRETLERVYTAKKNKKTQNAGIGGASVATVGTAITEAAKQIEPLASASQIAQYVMLGLLVVGVLVTIKAAFFSKES